MSQCISKIVNSQAMGALCGCRPVTNECGTNHCAKGTVTNKNMVSDKKIARDQKITSDKKIASDQKIASDVPTETDFTTRHPSRSRVEAQRENKDKQVTMDQMLKVFKTCHALEWLSTKEFACVIVTCKSFVAEKDYVACNFIRSQCRRMEVSSEAWSSPIGRPIFLKRWKSFEPFQTWGLGADKKRCILFKDPIEVYITRGARSIDTQAKLMLESPSRGILGNLIGIDSAIFLECLMDYRIISVKCDGSMHEYENTRYSELGRRNPISTCSCKRSWVEALVSKFEPVWLEF